MVFQVSSLGYIDLKWSNLPHSLQKLAFLDPFWTPNWLSRAPKYIFVLSKMLQIHLWPNFPWHRPEKWSIKWVHHPEKTSNGQIYLMALRNWPFGPQIDILEAQNRFFWRLKCFKSATGHISHGIDHKNDPSSKFPSLNKPQMAQFSS